jgi:biopolymer transport protein ExbD
MAMLTASPNGDDDLLTTINTTPLVDVMLVLLIIFLLTIPAVTASINVNLPQGTQQPHVIAPDSVVLTVDRTGMVFVNESRVESTPDLEQTLKELAAKQPQPALQILGDADTAFHEIGKVLNLVKSAGLHTIHFVIEPKGELPP